jgi:hypothetical protein
VEVDALLDLLGLLAEEPLLAAVLEGLAFFLEALEPQQCGRYRLLVHAQREVEKVPRAVLRPLEARVEGVLQAGPAEGLLLGRRCQLLESVLLDLAIEKGAELLRQLPPDAISRKGQRSLQQPHDDSSCEGRHGSPSRSCLSMLILRIGRAGGSATKSEVGNL